MSSDLKGIPWIFSIFDTDRSDSISTNEVKVVLNRMLGQENAEEVGKMLEVRSRRLLLNFNTYDCSLTKLYIIHT